MGTDIHAYMERRVQTSENTGYWAYSGEINFEYSRNYSAFALLADVRNYNNIAPIKPCEGWPEDGDPVTEEHNSGYHNFTYYSLAELNDYNWKKKVKESGVVPFSQYVTWDKKSPFHCYSRAVGGGGTYTISMEEADKHLVNPCSSLPGCYVQCEWESAEVNMDDNWCIRHIFLGLQELAKEYNLLPGEVRVLLSFDS